MARLTEREVQTAKPGRHSDGDGLHLVVSETGRKKWVLRYQVGGIRKDRGLGAYPAVGLKDARHRGAEARKLLARGIDPIEAERAAKKAAKPIPTFRDIAALVIEDAQAKSVNAKVRYQWERHLGPVYSGPLLDRTVHEITALDVAAVLRPVWRSKPEVARKLYPAIRRVFDRARVILRDEHGIAMLDNPARWDDLKAMGFETPKELTKGNYPSLPLGEMSEFIVALRERKAMAALALELLILTNVRTNALLQAKWPEFDLDKALWNVPLLNLKDREHRKHLRGPAIAEGGGDREGDGKGPSLGLRFPRPEESPAAVEHCFPSAAQAHECNVDGREARPKMARSCFRPRHHGSWVSRHLQDLGRGGRDFSPCRDRARDGTQGRWQSRARLHPDDTARHAPEAHGRLGLAL
jgi:integrase